MAQKKSSAQFPISPIAVAFVVAGVFLAFTVIMVSIGPGSTKSRASRNDFLTPGDDALSLQQDLNRLSEDPAAADEAALNTLQ